VPHRLPAILMGRIFDDRGNRMTPSHSNKDGVRYRYYVSHLLLQRRCLHMYRAGGIIGQWLCFSGSKFRETIFLKEVAGGGGLIP
jgi:hypothetical protein